jgi:ferritin-like metal-binding protein YciE
MGMQSIQDLFEHELKDILFAEQHLVKALEQLESESQDEAIKAVFATHLEETRGHVKNVEAVFGLIDKKPSAQTCKGILGLLDEKKDFAKENPVPGILEIFNLTAAMKTERYEITAYESLIKMAKELDLTEARDLLKLNLAEEEAALAKLHSLAQKK